MSTTETTTVSAPSKFLGELTGGKVVVKLYSGEEYHGTLDTIDGYMNIALEETQEVVEGTVTRKYGDVFIRGNNGMLNMLSLHIIITIMSATL
ncbi:U6 snRNA-associated Sm-like protein LSm6 [Cyberlindnera fabianii]|uniref:U6 snRNA-associated Sm-like protein LSm6 n=1 Tax=Cyberlindnera fabianii TaxID=36022 RepID=A0A1V2LD86_CYBFA|nr:U6 snRNA-associated Sm-like protein LSm6 [Cyberlindnera fabianii]